MTKQTGMLTQVELSQLVSSGQIETMLVVFTDLYGRFMGKRFDAEFFVEQVADNGTHACDYLLTVDMEMEPVAGYQFANWERGYGDFHLVPDLETIRIADWLDKTALVLCDVQDVSSHDLVRCAPRTLLKKQIEHAANLGFTANAASELEFYLFRESYRDAAKKNYHGLEAKGWYLEDYHAFQGTRHEDYNAAIRRHLTNSGVPVESTKGEWGLGQHELNVRYTDVLAMADRHVIIKQCLKDAADRQEFSVTFMAKFAEDQAGSSCHIHLSLWNGDDNAFAGDSQLGSIDCSETFRWFLGGWIKHVNDFMPFYAPTVNSYKRYQPGSWAPTRLAWSGDNRTAGFRIVGAKSSLRIECRLPGADCNPYLAFTAALASGMDGIEQQIEPPDEYQGDVYSADDVPHVPTTLKAATDLFAASEFVKQTLGVETSEHYSHFFRTEQAAYDTAVTDWERRRYFERI